MERLQELQNLIDAQSLKVKECRTAYSVVADLYENKIVEAITKVLNPITQVKVIVSTSGYSTSGSINLLVDDDKCHHSCFDFYYDCRYGENEYKLKVNIGTCGSFGIDDKEQFTKYRLFTEFLNNFEEIENAFKDNTSLIETTKILYHEQNILDKYNREVYEIEKEQKENELKKSVKAGNFYKNKNYHWYRKCQSFKGYEYIRVVGFTNKSANLEVGRINPKGCYDEGWRDQDTYRMNIDEFYNAVINGSLVQVDPAVEILR